MKIRNHCLNLLLFTGALGISQGATITVNTADSTDFSAGKTNLVYALTNLNNGDTIAFNIPGAGPHFLETPAGGFPIVIKDNVTIDGYSQPGAVPNSNPLTQSNNAVIKIVLDSRNGNYRDMEYPLFTLENSSPPIDNTSMATERGGYGFPERAVLGIYRATNVNIRGLAFLGSEGGVAGGEYAIAVAHDYGLDPTVKDRLAYTEGSSRDCHINGCWIGINPTNPTVEGMRIFQDAVAFFRHRDASPPVVPVARPELPNESLILGVKAGSTNPRAQFNVIPYMAYITAGEAIRTRVSGNFLGVLPDGVTPSGTTPGVFQSGLEVGRYDDTQPIVLGTDGDGVNDADEGNLIGPILDGGVVFGFYSTGNKQYIIAGNRFGIGNDGTRWTNSQTIFDGFAGASSGRFGSDFNGVSDAVEANVVYNFYPFEELFPFPTTLTPPPRFIELSTGTRLSVRGNVLVNNALTPFDYVMRTSDGQQVGARLAPFTNYSAPYMNVEGPIIPALSTNSTTANLIGSCAAGTNSYTNIFIDVYIADLEGLTNGMQFQFQELAVGEVFHGFPQGKTYLGTFADNGVADSNPAVGAFNLNIASLGISGGALVTVTANYSADPIGTTNGRVHTSNFSDPVNLIGVAAPPSITSVTRTGNNLTITWSGGTPPFSLQRKSTITGAWTTIATAIVGNSTTTDNLNTNAFYRIGSN